MLNSLEYFLATTLRQEKYILAEVVYTVVIMRIFVIINVYGRAFAEVCEAGGRR